jgi:hypothetical protein
VLKYLYKLDEEGQAYELEARFGSGRAPLKGPVLNFDQHGVVLQTSGGPMLVGWQAADTFHVEFM